MNGVGLAPILLLAGCLASGILFPGGGVQLLVLCSSLGLGAERRAVLGLFRALAEGIKGMFTRRVVRPAASVGCLDFAAQPRWLGETRTRTTHTRTQRRRTHACTECSTGKA